MEKEKKIIIYQAKNGAIELKTQGSCENIWASQKQIAEVFEVDVRTVNEHLKNIFKTGELAENAVIRKFRITASDGKTYNTKHYNLDAIISVGYRVNSKTATGFRIWATKTLKQHITKGYTLNKKILKKNHQEFLRAVDDIKSLAEKNKKVSKNDVLELIKTFSSTWFQLESYDKQNFPKKGKKNVGKKIDLQKLSDELYSEIEILKKELIKKKEATKLFAQEKSKGGLEGILGNVVQSVFGKDVYPTVEEKAVHLLYFVIKNHAFNDGNKRTGAFCFIWFLQKMNFNFTGKVTPESLTTLTLLIAESKPKDKEKMIGLTLLLLQ